MSILLLLLLILVNNNLLVRITDLILLQKALENVMIQNSQL